MKRAHKRFAFTLIELFVCIGILSLLLALLLPAIQRVRAASDRALCMTNLHQIGVALHSYHNDYHTFPPGCSFRNGKDPQQFMSWCTRLLPYIEQDTLWSKTVSAFGQAPFFETVPPHVGLGTIIKMYHCPSDERESAEFPGLKVALLSYLGVEGTDLIQQNGVLYLDSKIRIGEITDGTSNTLIVGERPPSSDMRFGWWYAGWGQQQTGSMDMVLGVAEINIGLPTCSPGPERFRRGSLTNQCDSLHFWSLHNGGGFFLFADGSVHFLKYEIDAKIMNSLSTRRGGESELAFD